MSTHNSKQRHVALRRKQFRRQQREPRHRTNLIRLNGGTFTVGGFTKTKTAQTNVIQFNGGLLKAGAANAAFLPAFSVSSNYVQAGGAKIDDSGFTINAISAPLIHDPGLGSSLDGGLTKLGNGSYTLARTILIRPTLITAGTLAL
jgi:hypothetical protein